MATLSSQLKLTVLDGVTGPMRRINGVLNGFQRQQTAALAPFRGVAGQLLAFGGAYLGVTKGISSTVGAAIEFESAFADVRKVVDASDEQFANMSRTIKAMSRELPMTSVEIAQLFAAAGESDIPVEELKSFAEMASRVGIAFDMSAGEAGESLAKLKSQLGLSVGETGDMADAINHLSNNMASKAKDITAYMLRVGKLAEMGGLAKEQVAAIGSAMISAGAEAETAGTAMQNVVRAMTRGASAKKSQRDAAKALGLDLPALAKQMQKDAPGAIKKVLGAIAKAPKDRHISLISDFFGDEAKAFAPLIGNIGLLDKALDAVANKTNYSGSAFREYVERANTTANALQILRNKIAYVFEDMGEAWLPTIKEGVAAIGGVLDTLGERAGVFDKLGVGLKGFMHGLGYNGGVKEAIEGLGDLLFGEVDGEGAADKLGRIFKQFEGYGQSVREFSAAIRDNPVAQFLGEIGAQGFKLMAASVGIALVAGAVMKLARAVAFLTGITTAIGLLKTFGKIGGILGGAAGFPGLGGGKPGATTGGTPAGNAPAVGWWSRVGTWFKGLGMGAAIGSVPQILSDTPGDTFEKQVENQAKAKEGLRNLLGLNSDEQGVPGWKRFLFGAAADPNFDSRQHFGIQTKAGDDTSGSPRTTGEMLAGLDKPVTLDSATISQIVNPRGVQDVRVTNKERPNITVHAPVTITNISSPQEAVDAAASRLGQRIKAEIEAADTD
ncbi:phage tail tape measure protein [Shinella sp. DD12]|uniref:phage tail tape measure protein n=1 Tax=Shinella sp. DD12 TaxID=1410620 RepID=UPI000437CAFC|nr:phage tail tape measure protein [Shinella sp. DD12]EYR81888.1 phage tail tape measure protein, family [Shinella sp. DD12]